MRNRIIVASMLWMLIVAAMLSAGCSQEFEAVQGSVDLRNGGSHVLHDGFRIRRDAGRNRIWLLGLDGVRVYEARTRRLIREVALPGWSVAHLGCDPDLVLDGSGSAVVSSNVQSRLWRIDARTFEISEYPIELDGRENWEVGFGALAMIADGTLVA